MGKGLKTKGGRIMQWIRHGANPNLFDPNGLRVVCSNFEEYEYAEAIDFDKIRRQGAKALHANVPLEGMWTGSAKGALGYNLIDDQLLPYLIAKQMRDETIAGVRETEYRRPQFDRADRDFFAVQEGIPTDCELGCFGFITGFKWSSKRGNKGTSRFDLSFVTQTAVPFGGMTGAVLQNAILSISAANVASDGIFAVTRKGQGSESVTIRIGDTTAIIKAAFEGLNSIDGVTVVGMVAAAAGEKHTLLGTGNTFSIYADILVDTATATLLTVQNAIRAKAGRSTAVVTGTLTKPKPQGFVVSGAGDAASNGTYIENGVLNTRPTYALGANRVVRFEANVWVIVDVVANSSLYRNASTSATPPETGWTTDFGAAPAPTGSLQAPSAGAADITIQYDAAAGNVGDIEAAPGAGYAGTTTQPGNAGGNISITVTNPANTPISIVKTSGGGWSSAVTQQGSDGDIIGAIVEPLPVLPSHILLYHADTLDGLDLPGALVGKVQDWEYNDSKICQPQSHHALVNDPARPNLPATYDSYSEEETEEDSIVLTTTLNCDDNGEVAALVAMARATGGRYVSKAGYWRIVATCPIQPYLIKCEFYGSIGASIPRKFGGNVEQRTLVFDLIENRQLLWALRWITRRPV